MQVPQGETFTIPEICRHSIQKIDVFWMDRYQSIIGHEKNDKQVMDEKSRHKKSGRGRFFYA
jgi:hypothetical protein